MKFHNCHYAIECHLILRFVKCVLQAKRDNNETKCQQYTGASLGISNDGFKMPDEPLGISLNRCKSTFKPCFQQNSMGAMRPLSKSMGANAPIDPT